MRKLFYKGVAQYGCQEAGRDYCRRDSSSPTVNALVDGYFRTLGILLEQHFLPTLQKMVPKAAAAPRAQERPPAVWPSW